LPKNQPRIFQFSGLNTNRFLAGDPIPKRLSFPPKRRVRKICFWPRDRRESTRRLLFDPKPEFGPIMGWLVLGTLLGALLGSLSIPWNQHGWESEAYYPYRIVWGTLIGLAVGLVIDFIGQYNRRKRDE
jgi:hypothetical protein